MKMEKIKVLCLSTSLNIGGTEKFIAALIENLGDQYDFSAGYLKEKGGIGDYLDNKGIPVRKFSGPFQIRKYLIENNISLLHTFLYRANIIGRFAGRLAGTRAVISTQQAIDAWKNPFFAGLDGFTSRWCDAVIANSGAAKEVLVARDGVDPDKIRVVYNGLDASKFKPSRSKEDNLRQLGIKKNGPVILSSTRLHKEKGADLLPEIAGKVPNGFFIVAGDGPEMGNMRSRVQALGLSDRFILLGWRSDISDLLAAADIFIMPSREESFPQAILEAMSLSLPVVASDVGGVKELVNQGKTGILVPPGDTDAFAAALNELSGNPGKAAAMGAAGRQSSLNFTEEKMIASIRSVYQEVLRRKNAI